MTALSNEAQVGRYGPALIRYLEPFWKAEGLCRNTWAGRHGISSPQLGRWEFGQTPSLESLRHIATEINRPMLDVLVGSGLLTSDEADGCDIIAAAVGI